MARNIFEKWISKSAELLDIKVEYDLVIDFENEGKLNAPVRIDNIGGVKGMLIFTNNASVRNYRSLLTDLGYGYSVIRLSDKSKAIDAERLMALLTDWGWSGDSSDRPDWLVNRTF